MRHTEILPISYNMSLGLIPVIITIALCELLPQNTAICIGTGIGVLGAMLPPIANKKFVPNIILYLATSIMALLCAVSFLPGYIPEGTLPITLEASYLVTILLLYMHRKKAMAFHLKHVRHDRRHEHRQGMEASIVSVRIVLFFGALHLIIACIYTAIQGLPTIDRPCPMFYWVLPISVFVFSLLLNQYLLFYFNRLMSLTEYLPIVTPQGEVIGKIPTTEIIRHQNLYTHPVVRIAVIVQGMLLLGERPSNAILDGGKTDIPMETYLRYNESISAGVERLMKGTFPPSSHLHPTFSITYQFHNDTTNRLVYLFIIDIDNEPSISSQKRIKPWNLQQIEDNLGKGFFSSCFEEEYEHLKEVIYTREKYKES